MYKNHLENSEDNDVSDYWNDQLSSLNVQTKKITKQILEIIKSNEDLSLKFNNLQTVTGIAEITAIAILAEVQDVSKFLSARQLVCYIGVTPRHKKPFTQYMQS